jgi:Cu-processing system ATP-binding protein
MIEIRNLNKSYGRHKVLTDVNLDIPTGQVTALLGPNGAGKSTLIKCLMGMVHPDSGSISWKGEPVNDPIEWKKLIGYMPQRPSFPENLRISDIINMLKDIRGNEAEIAEHWLVDSGLTEHMAKRPSELSGGNRQKLNALVAFMFSPEILFLDEPTAGMDPIVGSRFKDEVTTLRDHGKTVILTSHVLSEVEQMANHLVYIIGGQVVLDIPLVELLDRTGTSNLERAMAAHLMEMAS